MTWEDIRGLWHWLVTSRYTRQLEETNLALELENEELRADNRALINGQLQQAGVRALPEVETKQPPTVPRFRRLSLHQRQRLSAVKTRRQAVESAKDARDRAIGGQ